MSAAPQAAGGLNPSNEVLSARMTMGHLEVPNDGLQRYYRSGLSGDFSGMWGVIGKPVLTTFLVKEKATAAEKLAVWMHKSVEGHSVLLSIMWLVSGLYLEPQSILLSPADSILKSCFSVDLGARRRLPI